jgi:hypothetical protein
MDCLSVQQRKEVENWNEIWMLLNFEDGDHNSGRKRPDIYLHAPIHLHGVAEERGQICDIACCFQAPYRKWPFCCVQHL